MRVLSRARFWLFAAAGLAVPFFAFPVAYLGHRKVDLATVFVSLFVVASVLVCLARRQTIPAKQRAFLVLAMAVPLLVLLPPVPARFVGRFFAFTFLHWTLVVLFFMGGSLLELSASERRRLLVLNVAAGALVALFALYQVAGMPRGWPATGEWVFATQREPMRSVIIGGALPGHEYRRPTSVFLEPAWMGGYLAWVLALCLGLLHVQPSRRGRTIALTAATAGILGAIVASVSWGAYLDTLAVLATMALASGRVRKTVWTASLCAVVAAAGLLLTPAGRSVRQALISRWHLLIQTPLVGQESAVSRDSSWLRLQNAASLLEFWREHPVGGLGLGQLDLFKKKKPATEAEVLRAGRLCGWVAIGAEAGTLGPVILAAAVGLVLRRSRRPPPADRDSVVLALVVLAVVQQLHTGSYIDLWWWFPLTLACALAGGETSRESVRATDPGPAACYDLP